MQIESDPKATFWSSGTPGGFVFRLTGVLLLLSTALALFYALGFCVNVSGAIRFVRSFYEPKIPGLWRVSGWVAQLHFGILCAVSVFAGIQLLRLRRSGWIAVVVVLAYDILCLLLSMQADSVETQLRSAMVQKGLTDSSMVMVHLEQNLPQIERIYRAMRFVLLCHILPFVYLVSEWWRFWGKRGWYASARLIYTKMTLCFVILAMSGVWTFWGADYYFERTIFRKAHSARPDITEKEWAKVSLRAKREIEAILVRRLVTVKTDDFANSVWIGLVGFNDISLLNAEDIPAIIAAVRSPSLETRITCYRLLAEIGTKEAETCLREAVVGPRNYAWNTAVKSLAQLRPSSIPDVLFKVARDPSDTSRHWVLMHLSCFDDPQVASTLLEASKDQDAEIRKTAVFELGMCGSSKSEQVLQEVLRHKDMVRRGRACYKLAYVGTAASIPLLIEMLREPNYMYPKDKTVGGVEIGDIDLHDQVAYALQKITGQDFDEDADKWASWWNEAQSSFDIEQNAREGISTPLPPVPNDKLTTPVEVQANTYYKAISVQHRALRQAQAHRMQVLAPDLARYLKLPDSQAACKFVAAEILVQWGYREGIEWLIDWVDNDAQDGTRMFAIRALGPACRVNFFSDKERWRNWWKENSKTFPSATAP